MFSFILHVQAGFKEEQMGLRILHMTKKTWLKLFFLKSIPQQKWPKRLKMIDKILDTNCVLYKVSYTSLVCAFRYQNVVILVLYTSAFQYYICYVIFRHISNYIQTLHKKTLTYEHLNLLLNNLEGEMRNKANITQNSCTQKEKSLVDKWGLGDSPEHPDECCRSASQKIR